MPSYCWIHDLPDLIVEQIAVRVAASHPLTDTAMRNSECPPSPETLAKHMLFDATPGKPLFLSTFHLITAESPSTTTPLLLGFKRRYRLVDTDLVVQDECAYRRTNAAPCVAIKKISFHILRLLDDVLHQVGSIRFSVHTLGTSMVVNYKSRVDPGLRPDAFSDLTITNDD